MYCIKCGQELPDNAQFCCYCGESIKHNDLDKNDLKEEIREQEFNSEQLISNNDKNKTKKRLTKKTIVAITIVAILLIIGSVIIGVLKSKNAERDNVNEVFKDYEKNSTLTSRYTVDEIFEDYERNPALASDKYNDKKIELEMCVDSIEKDYVTACISGHDEYDNYYYFSIWVHFKSVDEIRDISVGDNVVFAGRIDDTPYDNPDLGRVSTIDLLDAEFVCKTDGHGHLISNENFEHAILEKDEYVGNWIGDWEGKVYAMVIEPAGAESMPYSVSIVEVGANKFWNVVPEFKEDGYFYSDSEECFSKDEDDNKSYIYHSSECLIYSNYGFIIWESEKNGVVGFAEYDGDAWELFSNSLVVEWDSEEEIIEEEVSENEVEDSVESNTTSNSSLEWKRAYLDYLYENGNTNYGYSLDYIDEDNIPELVIDTGIAAYGTYLCTYSNGKVIETPVGEFFIYLLQENSVCVSGGRMDTYYHNIYEIVDGLPMVISEGRYGLLDYNNVQYDEYGYPIYQYMWNGELVSEYDYYSCIEKFSFESGWGCLAGNGYLYDIIDILEHPLDITIINAYIHNAGYGSSLNSYVINFDRIEDDKIHFTVRYNDEVVASLSATIVDAKTAVYKNNKSELVISFCEDYYELKIEGYIDTIDLTSTYWGMWG